MIFIDFNILFTLCEILGNVQNRMPLIQKKRFGNPSMFFCFTTDVLQYRVQSMSTVYSRKLLKNGRKWCFYLTRRCNRKTTMTPFSQTEFLFPNSLSDRKRKENPWPKFASSNCTAVYYMNRKIYFFCSFVTVFLINTSSTNQSLQKQYSLDNYRTKMCTTLDIH